MRVADIFGLALAALWQQKVRTLLTTLGVIFGSFVLSASLSVNQGVQDTIQRASRRSTHLREVHVQPNYGGNDAEASPDEIEVKGNMSEDRRARIRKTLLQRQRRYGSSPKVLVTRQALESLGKIEHVERVVPVVRFYGWATLDNHSQVTNVISTNIDDARLRQRLIAGRFFETPKERSAIISELLLYQLGMADDASISAAVGKRLHLDFRNETYGAGLSVFLNRPGGAGLSREETTALDKINKKLSGSLEKLGLSTAEADVLRHAVQSAPPRLAEIVPEEFTIAGVVRLDDEDQEFRWVPATEDVFLPTTIAQDIFFRSGNRSDRGLDEAIVFVDHEHNVKDVVGDVRKLGLNGYAPLEFIERERLMYLLIFGAMSCVAGVALLVAALGIANTMLMSVLERTREVGIMKAVGAANLHVQLIFLLEGAIVGLLGGGLGVLLGWAASIPGDSWVRSMVQRDMKVELKESIFVFPPWIVLSVMLFAVVVTTLAAVYPARRAAKVDPVKALRHE